MLINAIKTKVMMNTDEVLEVMGDGDKLFCVFKEQNVK